MIQYVMFYYLRIIPFPSLKPELFTGATPRIPISKYVYAKLDLAIFSARPLLFCNYFNFFTAKIKIEVQRLYRGLFTMKVRFADCERHFVI